MNRKTALGCMAVLSMAVVALAGCSNNTSDVKLLGEPGAQQVFLYGITPQNYAPIYGFDIAYVGPSGNFYLAESAVVPSILTTSTGNLTSFEQAGMTGGGDFAGSITDSAHQYEGGPNGVVEVNYTQVWVGDDAHFIGTGTPGDDYVYTPTTSTTCDSSVKVIDKTHPAGPYIIYTNGCFKSDELGYGEDSTHKWILVANPEEDSTLVTNTNTVNINSVAVAVPTAPFVTLINADLSAATAPTTGSVVADNQILAQIAFDGTNHTPNADQGIEQPVYSSATGLFYVSVPDDSAIGDGAIAVIDPANKVALAEIPLTDCSPSGMALGPDGKEVFLACSNPDGMQVVSLVTEGSVTKGEVLATIPLSSMGIDSPHFDNGCDEAWYNPSLNQYMTACNPDYGSTAYVPVINAGTGLDGTAIKPHQLIDVQGAFTHSVASDPVTGAIMVPLQPGDPLCPTYVDANNSGVGCIGVWAPEGGALQKGIY